jgi:aspartate carbamoyltransferase
MNRHLISCADLTAADALSVLDTAEQLARLADRPIPKLPTLRGRTVVNLFYEDSTRTRISFEAAAKRLSADVINFSAKGSSVAKGESLKDTALTLQAMGADAVVIRHNASGAPHRLAEWVAGSVINAGDGTHEHPTQALLDAFTIRRRLGRLDGLRVAIVGDILHSRVARSNVWLLRTLGAAVTVVALGQLRLFLGAAVQRRGDDAAGSARADVAGLLPDRPRVQPQVRTRPRPDGAAARPCDRDAPWTDEPRGRDRGRGGRLAEVDDRRAGG